MQGLMEMDKETELLTAEELREVTITPEQLYERQRKGILDSLMSSMVGLAQSRGATSYVAELGPDFSERLLTDTTDKLTSLGYTVAVERSASSRRLAIGWAPAGIQNA